MLKTISLKTISFYKSFLSPYLGGNCKFQPTCSDYGYDAVSNYGALKGLFMITKRLIKCHPFSKGGYDPIN